MRRKKVESRSEAPPDRIVGTYTDDYDIVGVHDLLMRRFNYKREDRLRALVKQRNELDSLSKTPQTILERRHTLQELTTTADTIRDIQEKKDILRYTEQAEPLLAEYKRLGSAVKVISLKKKATAGRCVLDARGVERHQVVSKFLQLAGKYIQVDVVRDLQLEDPCPGCGVNLDGLPSNEYGVIICPTCQIEKYFPVQMLVPVDAINATSARNGYDDRENFNKALLRYEGKEPANRIPGDLVDRLDVYFKSYSLPVSLEIKAMPLTNKGTRGETSREMMYKALGDTGLSDLYENTNLICHIYWGWKLPDVSHLEGKIMDDYDRTQRVYNCLIKKRSSSLNSQYRLFKHLQLRGHKCCIEDFKLVRTPDILSEHDEFWREMVEHAWTAEEREEEGIKFIPTI